MITTLKNLTKKQIVLEGFSGLASGLLIIVSSVSLASLVFSGAFAGDISVGVSVFLVSAVIANIFVSMRSAFPFVLHIPQDAPTILFSLMALQLANKLSAADQALYGVSTIVFYISLTTICTGLFLYALGKFKLSNLVRFIPYPVVGGFLAGTGWLIIKRSMEIAAGIDLKFSTLPAFFEGAIYVHWAPVAIFAIGLLACLRRFRHVIVYPIFIFGAIAIFLVALYLSNTSITQAHEMGWVISSFPTEGLWQPLDIQKLSHIKVGLIWDEIGTLLSIIIVSTISVMLNGTGIELFSRGDMDLDQELKYTGLSNIFNGLASGTVSYHTVGFSLINYELGVKTRFATLVSSLLCGVLLFFGFGASLLQYLPIPLLMGLVMFIGLGLIAEWLYDGWRKFTRKDYILVIGILLVVAQWGFILGVGIGIVVSILLFVWNYSRLDVVKFILTGGNVRSNVERPAYQQEIITKAGDQIHIFRLQGFIFFGSAYSLLQHIRAEIKTFETSTPDYLIYDFRLITGLDSSALMIFRKMKQFAQKNGVSVIFTNLQGNNKTRVEDEVGIDNETCFQFNDVDHAVEWVEEQVLKSAHKEEILPIPFESYLHEIGIPKTNVKKILPYFEKKAMKKGDILYKESEKANDMYYLESGEVTVFLDRKGRKPLRLRTLHSGTIVGEMGLYTGGKRSASVVVEKPSTLYRLTIKSLENLHHDDPGSALSFHQNVVRLISARLKFANEKIDAMLV